MSTPGSISPYEVNAVFADAWYKNLAEFYRNKIEVDPVFHRLLKRFNAAEEYPITVIPFGETPTARYVSRRGTGNNDSLSGIPMAISDSAIRPFAPGKGLFQTLLQEVPAGYIKPVTTKDAELDHAGYTVEERTRIQRWLGTEEGYLHKAEGVYALPLFLGKLPLYVIVLGYEIDRHLGAHQTIATFDLSTITAMMQSCQRWFATILTFDCFEIFLKKCVHAARMFDPRFQPGPLLQKAADEGMRPWKSWYQCVPGTKLADLPEAIIAHDELKNRIARADQVDPEKLWMTIWSQFNQEQFFGEKCHECWMDVHEEKQKKILPVLEGFGDNLKGRKSPSIQDRCQQVFVASSVTLLRAGRSSFDKLKALYCKRYGDRSGEQQRLMAQTLRTCFEIVLRAEQFDPQYDGNASEVKLCGNNCWDLAWDMYVLVTALSGCISKVAISQCDDRGNAGADTQTAILLGFEFGNEPKGSATGVDAGLVADILRRWDCQKASQLKKFSQKTPLQFLVSESKDGLAIRELTPAEDA